MAFKIQVKNAQGELVNLPIAAETVPWSGVNGKQDATESVAGLMSSSDKIKLNGIESGANKYVLPTATSSTLGGVKSSTTGTTSGRDYKVQVNSDGTMKVNVPWVDTNTTYSKATSTTLGLVKIGYTTEGKNYAVQLDTDGKMFVNVPWTDTNTTYGSATQSTAGLMSAADKTKLDGITSSADSVSFTRSLTTGTKIGTININGTATDLFCQTNTDTHYTTKLYVGASDAESNAATTNGNTYIKLYDNNTSRANLKISGSGATTVTSDANGNITINSTNTTYGTASTTANGLMSSADKAKLDGIAASANKYVLPTATSSTLGGVKSSTTGTTSGRDYKVQVNSDGTMKVNVPWTDTNTNYYPTSWTWTNGTSNGPTASLSGSGMSAVAISAIPAASLSQSGIITTGSQTLSGTKTFIDEVAIKSRFEEGDLSFMVSNGPIIHFNKDGQGTYSSYIHESVSGQLEINGAYFRASSYATLPSNSTLSTSPSSTDDSTKIATTAFVNDCQTCVKTYSGSVPTTNTSSNKIYYRFKYNSSYDVVIVGGGFSAGTVNFPVTFSSAPFVLTVPYTSTDMQSQRTVATSVSTTSFTTKDSGSTYYGRYIAIGRVAKS